MPERKTEAQKYPNVTKYAGGPGEPYENYEKETLQEAVDLGGRTVEIIENRERPLNRTTLAAWTAETIHIEFLKDPKREKVLNDMGARFRTIAMQKDYDDKERKALWDMFYATTKGGAKAIVIHYTVTKVHELRAEFKRLWGSTEELDVKKFEAKLESGSVREDGKKMQSDESPVVYFNALKRLADQLKRKAPTSNKWQDENLEAIAERSLPSMYQPCIEASKLRKANIRLAISQNAGTIDAFLETMDPTAAGETLTLAQLETSVLHQWKLATNRQKEAQVEEIPTMLAADCEAGKRKSGRNTSCWNCGLEGHVGQNCSEPQSQEHCPAKMKGQYDKDWVPSENPKKRVKFGVEVKGNSKPKGKGNRGGLVQQVCYNWRDKGSCKWGDRCNFAHEGKPGKPEQPNMQSLIAKTANSVMKMVESNMSKAVKAAKGKGTKSKSKTDSSSTIYNMIAASMGTGGKSNKDKAEQGSSDESDEGKYTCLVTYLHDISTVGMDSCSGRACSTEREDFLTLDESEVVRGVSMSGIGGKTGVTGIGTMVVTARAPSIGKTVLIVDPDAVYIKPEGKDSPRFRVFCMSRLKKMGLIMTNQSDISQPTKLVCVRTQREIVLEEQGGISVLRSKSKDARNYKRNIALKAAIKGMKTCTQSPLFVDETQRVVEERVPIHSCLLNFHDEFVDMKEYRENEQRKWCTEMDKRENVLPMNSKGLAKLATKKKGKVVRREISEAALVITIGRLTQPQLARLWHWRFGHAGSDMPVSLTRKGRVVNLGVNHRLCEDCHICDKAKFRIAPFPRSIMVRQRKYPPYHIVYADGCGGQRSMGVKSFGGAVGNFIFVDITSGDYQSLLYSKRSQFPALLERYLIGVLALQYEVRILRVDGDSVNISAQVEELASQYGFVVQPMSAGTPQENGFAEKAVGDATRQARAFMLGAPHIHKNKWGVAYRYASFVNLYLEKTGRGGLTPYQSIHHRIPNMKRSGLHVFGCPAQMVPLDKAANKMSEITVDSYFLGLDPPSFLMQRIEDGKVMRVSPKKVRCHEGMYCMDPLVSMERLEQLVSLVDSDEDEDVIPSAVPSIKALKPGVLYDPLSNQGREEKSLKENPKIESEYSETHEEIGQSKSDTHLEKLREDLLSAPEDVQESIARALARVREKAKDKSVEGEKETGRVTREGKKPGRDHVPRERDVVRSSNRTSKRQRVMKGQEDKPTSQTNANLNNERAPDPALESLKAMRPPMSRVPVGSRVMIESKRFDGVDTPGRYSNTAPKYTHGTVQSRRKGGLVKVLWDGDSTEVCSHNTHLEYSNAIEQSDQESPAVEQGEPGEAYMSMCARLGLPEWQEPFRTLVAVERASVPKDKPQQKIDQPYGTANPGSTWEALVSPKWREWITAIRKEHDGWIAANVYEIVNKCEMKPGEMCIDIKEIFSVKRDGTPKYRSALRGDQLRKDVDYHTTFSGTVSADCIRMFFSLACQLGKQVRSGDVKCAYLQGKQRIPIYAFLPSYIDIIDLSWEELMVIRKDLLKLVENEGASALKNLGRKKRRQASRVLRLMSSVYGSPDAGNEWGLLLTHIFTVKMGLQRSSVDGCLYFLSRGQLVEPEGRGDSVWKSEYLVVMTWTDDIPYFGTPELEVWFKSECDKHLPMVWKDVCDDFISIEVKQDLERGTCELTQEKYWKGPQVRFGQYLAPPWRVRTPVPEGTVMVAATPEEHELAKHLPYAELVGTMAFPSCHTKLEIRFVISQLSKFMRCWNLLHWAYAIHCLKYCIYSAAIGMMYSQGLDQHGTNVLYAYADSAFTAPRSQGCRVTLMNGAVVSLSSQKHSTIDTSTTGAELTELFLASNDVVGFRNLLRDIGFVLQGPTVMYEDNQPAIAVAEGERNLASKTKHMDIRTWKLKERIDDQEIILHFCGTVDMLADIGTKALGVKSFEYLRDLMNGYALVRLRHQGADLPILVVCLKDLKRGNPVFRK